MTLLSLLRAYLLADPAIRAIVSTRIWPLKAPQNAVYPLVIIQMIDDPSDDHLRGTGMGRPRFQIDVYAKEGGSGVETAQTLAGAIRARLDAFTGSWTDTTVSPPVSYEIAVQRASGAERFEPGTTEGYFRHTSDWFIQHQGKLPVM